jgi:LacI family transcriptional regulator
MGMKAAQILMERLRGSRPGPGTALEMPFQLVERDST